MSFINIENERLHYKEQGVGSTIVFIHGNGSSMQMYDSEIRYYAKSFRAIAFDLPGHGKSSFNNATEHENFWNYSAHILKKALHEIGVNKYVIVGVGGGSVVALYLGIVDKDNVEGIFADSFNGNTLDIERVNRIIEQRKRLQNHFFLRMFYRYIHGSTWRENLNRDSHQMLSFAKKQEKFFENQIDFYSPVILSCSTRDQEISHVVKNMEELAKLIPNARVITFEGGRHPSCLSNRDAYRAMVKRFITEKLIDS